jgi:hypothetical protein
VRFRAPLRLVIDGDAIEAHFDMMTTSAPPALVHVARLIKVLETGPAW